MLTINATCNYIRKDDKLKLFLLTFHRIYEECLMNSNVSYIKIFKEPTKPENLPLLVVTSGMLTYQNMRIV